MYLRSDGRRVETCPISGTIARGEDPMSDAEQILKLLNSEKDACELTMCTDVDRNDKARVCQPGTIRVLGRRQIELYSKVIHTVDHVEGLLRDGFDALDAFLSHAWAVTVTGAPKLWAMRFIENHERSQRAWYGGAIGFLGFDGSMNTGLTLRTIRIRDGIAEVRAGATLLIDSDPASEEAETELKASAFLEVVRGPRPAPKLNPMSEQRLAARKRVFLVDCEDSFVNTLADYLRQAGAEVLTVRGRMSAEDLSCQLASYHPDLVFFSPGPGSPSDFDIPAKIDVAIQMGAPVFGVCLGLQGLVQYFGGQLAVLGHPVHGKTSRVRVLGGRILQGLPREFLAGRYHSLYAVRESLPSDLEITAESEDGIVMAIEHKSLPVAAVQFHPESIMTLKDSIGLRLIYNVLNALTQESSCLPAVSYR
jgi:anthranilate synthase